MLTIHIYDQLYTMGQRYGTRLLDLEEGMERQNMLQHAVRIC